MLLVSRSVRVAVALMALVSSAGFGTASVAAELPAIPPVLPLTAPMAQPATPAQVPDASPAVLTTADQAIAPDDTEETVAYPTLSAAVAAQDAAADDEQLRCLAGAIYYESRGEPLAGQLAVAEVILNRAASKRFGASVCDVITQPGQFSFVRSGRMPAARANADYRTATAIAKVAMKDAWESDASNAMYFHARRVAPGWSRKRIAAIGNHVFYR